MRRSCHWSRCDTSTGGSTSTRTTLEPCAFTLHCLFHRRWALYTDTDNLVATQCSVHCSIKLPSQVPGLGWPTSSPRKITSPSTRLSSLSSSSPDPFFGGSILNSSVSPSTKFMCCRAQTTVSTPVRYPKTRDRPGDERKLQGLPYRRP